jgi:hypothetical protein
VEFAAKPLERPFRAVFRFGPDPGAIALFLAGSILCLVSAVLGLMLSRDATPYSTLRQSPPRRWRSEPLSQRPTV